ARTKPSANGRKRSSSRRTITTRSTTSRWSSTPPAGAARRAPTCSASPPRRPPPNPDPTAHGGVGSRRPLRPRHVRGEKAPREMKKAAILVLSIVGTIELLMYGGVWWKARQKTAAGPVILISIDRLRAHHLPVYGYTRRRTPNIDALAAEATVFEHAWSHAPQTLPAHVSILSGQLPYEHGVRDNVGFTVKPGQWMLRQSLKSRGGPTGACVSAFVLRSATGLNQGFDAYDSDMPAASTEVS